LTVAVLSVIVKREGTFCKNFCSRARRKTVITLSMFTSLIRVVKFAFKNFWRNIWLSLATISIIILTLMSVSFLGFLNVLTQEAVESVKSKIDISVYFKPEITPQEVKAIQRKLSDLDKIKSIRFVSREDSIASLKNRHKDDILISESLSELGSNPLGDTLVIQAHEITYYPLILQALEQSQYQDYIQDKNYADNQEFLDRIHNVTEKIKKVGWVMTIVFALIAMLIVFNTIRIAIYSHSEEISIMQLVGADNWFIRAPFLVEAVLYAFVGSILTLAILYPILTVIDPYVLSFFDSSFSITAYYLSNLFQFAWWNFVGVLILTMVASFLAVGRYLDV
jgi:cell division transport system permease protein